jgi:hypothetical protein
MRIIDSIIVHHSASHPMTTAAQIREWHLARKFSDIGYHFVVEGDGHVIPGRPIQEIGAHCKGRNRNSVGVCVTGDNTKPELVWLPAQIESLRSIVGALRLVFDLEHYDVAPHHAFSSTACPGITAEALEDLLA